MGKKDIQIGELFFDQATLEDLLDESEYGASLVEWTKTEVAIQGGRVYLTIEDEYYQVEEPESRRTFSVLAAFPGVKGSGVIFEELG